nr:immunoglobulin heavy chain junction region [Mus musculus]
CAQIYYDYRFAYW